MLMLLGFMLKLQTLCQLCPAVRLWLCNCISALQQLLHAAPATACPSSKEEHYVLLSAAGDLSNDLHPVLAEIAKCALRAAAAGCFCACTCHPKANAVVLLAGDKCRLSRLCWQCHMRVWYLLSSYDCVGDYLLLLAVARKAFDLGLLTAYDPELKLQQRYSVFQSAGLEFAVMRSAVMHN